MSSTQMLKRPVVPGFQSRSAKSSIRALPLQRSHLAHALDQFVPVEVIALDGHSHRWNAGTGAGYSHSQVDSTVAQESKVKGWPRPRPFFASRDPPADPPTTTVSEDFPANTPQVPADPPVAGASEYFPDSASRRKAKATKRDRPATDERQDEAPRRSKRLRQEAIGDADEFE